MKKSDTDELRRKILVCTEEKLLNNGFYKFSMDELAGSLNISKKTLYKTFPTKEDLLKGVLTDFLNHTYSKVVSVLQAKNNLIEKFILFSETVEHYYRFFNEESIGKLKKYHPGLAYGIEDFRNKRVIPLIKILLKIGRNKKLILDIPDEIILTVFTSALGSIASKSGSFAHQTYKETFRYAFYLLLNGILTKKGKQILNYKITGKEYNGGYSQRINEMKG